MDNILELKTAFVLAKTCNAHKTKFMRIFGIMKARVNLTIEQDVLEKAKSYASKMGASVSELVEEYLKKITEPKEIKTDLFEMVRNLPAVELPEDFDYKEEYYKAKMKKYGF